VRRLHFETLRPVCPHCKHGRNLESDLRISAVIKESRDIILEGVLSCSDNACQLEYPVIDGIPILMVNTREYIANNFSHLAERDDLSETLESMLGDSVGADALYNHSRQHLSTYAWDAYADLDPAEADGPPPVAGQGPGAAKRCLDQGLAMLTGPARGPVVDIGCSVGRSSFELAQSTQKVVLGIDVNFSMLRLAQRVLREGRVHYPRRRIGLVYERREFPVDFEFADQVDFWACDAQMPPFRDGTFGLAVGLQVLDAVASPVGLLESISRLLKPAGAALLATPYDWSPRVTAIEAWIGGHSQRGPGGGAAEPLLRALLTPGAHPQSVDGMQLDKEMPNVAWHTRVHDRSTTCYSVHLFSVAKDPATLENSTP
jgi:SAM-dependent methyltransferase/uncharacterized protein YbaR (Trm112 family)